MADVQKTLDVIFAEEGGLAQLANDHGGTTKYGISLAFLKGQGIDINGDGEVNGMDVVNLTKDEAADLFIEHFLTPAHCEDLKSQKMSDKIGDMSVNMGVREAVTLFQRALVACGIAVKVDGDIGEKTIDAINDNTDAGNDRNLLFMVRDFQRAFYKHICDHSPDQVRFLHGWMNRVDAV